MRALVTDHREENRENAGNAQGRGHTAEELAVHRDEFELIIDLYDSKNVFFIWHKGARVRPSSAVIERANKEGWPILTTYSFDGVRNRLQSYETEENGILPNGKVRAIHQWNPNYPVTSTRGNGVKLDGYVACIMGDK